MPKWRNRQTRYVQGVVGATPWEFKSPLRHHDNGGRLDQRKCGGSDAARWHEKRSSEVWGDGRWPREGQRKVRAAKSEGAWRKPGQRNDVPLTVQIGTRQPARESNRDQGCASRVKRAILPAAISDSAASRLLAEAGSREPSPRRRGDRHSSREMTIREQNLAYPLSLR